VFVKKTTNKKCIIAVKQEKGIIGYNKQFEE
jgi:hypothetical protein